MKYFGFLIGVVALCTVHGAPQEEAGAYVYQAEDYCFNEHKSVTREYLEGLKRAKAIPEDVSKDFRCFLACLGKRLEVMSQEGNLHFDPLKILTMEITGGDVSHDDAHEMVSNCIDVGDEEDLCEIAFKYALCKVKELQPYNFSKGFCPTCAPA